MFKKCMSMLIAAAICMFSVCALAQENAVIPLGEGDKTVVLVVAASQDEMMAYELHTNQETLLDALLEFELIEVEKASWGYNVVSVCGVRAEYEKDGSYWAILEYDDAQGDFVSMETGIDALKLPDAYVMGFVLMK